MTAQNLWNEAAQLLNHAGSRPKPGRRPTRRGASIALRHKSIRHSDVLLLVRVEGGWAVDRRLDPADWGIRKVSPNSRTIPLSD